MDKKHLDDCYDLWKQSFKDSDAYVDYYFTEKIKENRILTLYDEQDLTAMLHLNPYLMYINGFKLEVNYMIGIAIDEKYNNQGRIRVLMIDALKKLYLEKHCFVYLMATASKLYKPYDFKYIYQQDRLSFEIGDQNTSNKQKNKINAVEIHSLQELDEKDLKKIVAHVNRKLKDNFNIFTVRSVEYYCRLLKEMKATGGDVLAFYRSGRLIGVISYRMDNGIVEVTESIIKKEFTKILVDKLITRILEERESKINITFLESYFLDDQVLKIQYPQLIKKQQAIKMARIINLPDFLKLFSTSRNFTRVIEVKDNIIEENNGVWKLSFHPDGCQAEKTDEMPERSMNISQIMDTFLKNAKIYINEII